MSDKAKCFVDSLDYIAEEKNNAKYLNKLQMENYGDSPH